MPLLLSGRGFRRELESAGVMAVHAPLEGGAETRLLRRLRAAGIAHRSPPREAWVILKSFCSRNTGSDRHTLATRALVVVPLLVRCRK